MSSQVAAKAEVAYLEQLLHEAAAGAGQVIPPEFALDAQTAAWLQQLRDRAAAWVRELAIPTKRDEDWRFTDLSSLLALNFQAAAPVPLEKTAIEPLLFPETAQTQLVFVNGVYVPALSSVSGLPAEVFVGNLGQVGENAALAAKVRNCLGQQPGNEEVFTALNSAGVTDAAVVWVPKNQIVETPIHLLFISVPGEASVMIQPRCLLIAEANSSVTTIEHFATVELQQAAPYFMNSVTEVWVEENAELTHVRVQEDGENAFHIGKSAIAQARNSRYYCHAVSLGGKLSRHNLEVFQTGEATETTLNGLTLLSEEQIGDTHSAIALNHPHGTTHQLHKCIVGDRAHAVFNGKIFVPKPAQLTNAGQLSRTLLLSPKARVDTKPQLEITADNVKCSHGATVSQLDAEEVFYLQSRGLDRQMSCSLLIGAFAGELIEQLPVQSLQTRLTEFVATKTKL